MNDLDGLLHYVGLYGAVALACLGMLALALYLL